MIEDILQYNKAFTARKGYIPYLAEKFPRKKLAVLACMDARLIEPLPAALGLKNGDAKIIKNAGGMVLNHWFNGFDTPESSVVRSLYILRHHPLIPSDVGIRGFVMDVHTGELSPVNEFPCSEEGFCR